MATIRLLAWEHNTNGGSLINAWESWRGQPLSKAHREAKSWWRRWKEEYPGAKLEMVLIPTDYHDPMRVIKVEVSDFLPAGAVVLERSATHVEFVHDGMEASLNF